MRKIIISKTATKNAIEIAEYIEAKFSRKFRNEFIEKVNKAFELIR
jgi:plasmid stabilization system protein ParE